MIGVSRRSDPLVSVVVATYNASHLLAHAMRSVLASTFEDWELIVVGDACSDDSEAVAREVFPEVRWANLEVNSGYQSAPNNEGIRMARGRYIALLNQDDLFLPDHLQVCVQAAEETGADLVWTPCALADPMAEDDLRSGDWRFRLYGVPPSNEYSPFISYRASSWFFRRELFEQIGPWRSSDEMYVLPSQEWLYRAARQGAQLRLVSRITVLLFDSGKRKDSYSSQSSPEHEFFAEAMRDGAFRTKLLESVALGTARESTTKRFASPLESIARGLLHPFYWSLDRLGVHPGTLNRVLAGVRTVGLRKRGTFVREHRRFVDADRD